MKTATGFTSILAVISLSGCLNQSNLTTTSSASKTSSTPSPAPTIPAGAKGVSFIFKQTSVGGSFSASPSGGTAAGTSTSAAFGDLATQAFLPDKTTVLESGGTSGSNWPKWISSLDLGISGPSNTAASNPDCARFSATSTGDTATCKYGSTTANCGAPADYFRISDIDCYNTTSTGSRGVGSGGPGDGVYIRAVFDRSGTYLGPQENIMVVLEYAASGYSASPPDIRTCFSGGSSKITSCVDSTWQIFLKETPEAAAQPFFLLTPPFFGYVNATTGTGGSAVSTRQFVLPLASSPSLTTLQISRTGMSTVLGPATATPNPHAAFQATCAPSGYPANSAYCLGMVFYSISFYRI